MYTQFVRVPVYVYIKHLVELYTLLEIYQLKARF